MDDSFLAARIEQANRLTRLCFLSFFQGMPITSQQAITLSFVVDKFHRHEDVFQKDLELLLFIRPSSVASLVSSLESAGYLVKAPLPGDARFKRLCPTQKALDIEGEIKSRLDAYYRCVYGTLSKEDMDSLAALMDRISDAARQQCLAREKSDQTHTP